MIHYNELLWIPDIDWDSHYASKSQKLFDTINDCFMNQHIDFPTRPSSNTQPDLVLSTDENTVRKVSNLGKLGKSDHCMIQIDIAGKVHQPKAVEYIPDPMIMQSTWLTKR